MALVHDDAIILVHGGRRGILRRIEHALDHALDGGDVNGGVGVGFLFVDFHDAEGFGKGVEVLHPGVLEGVGCLVAQRGAIHQEEDAAEPLGFKESINERDAGFGFARASGHGEQHLADSIADGALGGQDGQLLIEPDRETIIERLGG